MKNIIVYSFLALFFLASCEEDLELVPQQSLSDQTAFSDPTAAQGVLIGTYNLLQDLHSFGSMPQLISDYVTDNVNFVGTFTGLQEINTYSVTAGAGEISEIWRDTYEPILTANAIIANAAEVPGITDEEANRILGEAHFIRALCYFQLVNLFGQPFQVENGARDGVPLYLEPFTGEIVLLPRSSVNEVHQQIIRDLGEARTRLPKEIAQGRASSIAAIALESRLRLYREEWTEAADLANQVINDPDATHTLAPDYSFYNALSPEIIFSIENTTIDFENQNDEESGSGSWDSYYEPNDQGGRGDAPFSADLLAAFEPGDLRESFREVGTTFSGIPENFTLKYDDGPTNSSDPALIRFSEMLLNRAEALVEISFGNAADAISLINPLRIRAGIPTWSPADFATQDDLLEAIENERRLELAFEGHRRMDLLRRGKPLRTATSVPASAAGAGVGIVAGDDRAIFPIPQRELDLNGELTPNNGF